MAKDLQKSLPKMTDKQLKTYILVLGKTDTSRNDSCTEFSSRDFSFVVEQSFQAAQCREKSRAESVETISGLSQN